MIPGLTCADCARPMDLSRTTDRGYVHAGRCPRICTLEGCEAPRGKSARWCDPHAHNARKWGNPLGRPSMEIEDVEWMAETGEHFEGAARRVGMTPSGLDQALRRAGRTDLALALKSRRQGVAA